MSIFSFPKHRRLSNAKLIKQLLNKGYVINNYPVKVIWNIDARNNPYSSIQVLIIVPKKKIRSAVQRNYIKRLLRECFRKLHHECITQPIPAKNQLSLALIYIGNEKIEYLVLFKKIKELFSRLNKDVAFILE